ncbi:polar amino acid transport system ATP-binding protein/sulfate transport system ATP-binding protein/NitT/TauT family transport system ATP-binding protein [Filimonas zeae]|uniref:Spermidine/putrescine ABC transporter ATP-binding protein n=1 Tax=Filimonas zeae TaxID=1737353 RepID=A0A917IPJ4_9BACT|nr:ATP-binding cassette domain-containing protein [Filimonas zeae]MDR6337451.1 polar amino acid transport system ATP-binding protein/sulfate transport system ATP-binding protein/NitT/TauT family transport system ATP-binding protein [Filimonas zeae]GGH58689.1 spermidine/putrescine ABC transporter ATP-binding protein [Filimonas zeae]
MTEYTRKQQLLHADNVCLSYGHKPVLHNINFSIRNIVRPGVQQGQVVSLLGRSGIGKTQLFRLLAGLQQPTSGSITINGNKQVQAGDMGVVFQHYYLFEWKTIQQSLYMAAHQNPAIKGNEKAAVEKWAADFDITEALPCYPHQLSGGQRQRASIIQQLLKGSSFLLFDEPFSGLDVCVLDKVVNMLLQVSVSDELKTLIIVSHDIETSVAISDTVFILGKEPGEPGATIKKEIDLIERDLAWQKDIRRQKAFIDTLEEIKATL